MPTRWCMTWPTASQLCSRRKTLRRGARSLAPERVAGEDQRRVIVDRDRGDHAERVAADLDEALAGLAAADAPLDAVAAGIERALDARPFVSFRG